MKTFFFVLIFLVSVIVVNGESVMINMDVNNQIKVVNMTFGMQDTDTHFRHNTEIQGLLQTVGNKYFRIWVINQVHTTKNLIPYNCSHYNYTELLNVTKAVLNMGFTPVIGFPQTPDCMANATNSSGQPRGGSGVPPRNYSEYGEYMVNVTRYLFNRCDDGTLIGCGDYNNWPIEMWNEPTANWSYWYGWPPKVGGYEFTKMYMAVYDQFKTHIPAASLGTASGMGGAGYVDRFFLNISSDKHPAFYAYHDYQNNFAFSDPINDRYNGTPLHWNFLFQEKTYFDHANWIVNNVSKYNSTIPVFLMEYNIHPYSSPRSPFIDNHVGSAWTASTLRNLLKSGVQADSHFYGTDTVLPGRVWGYGLWNYTPSTRTVEELRPMYYTRKNYVKLFRIGYSLFDATTNDSWVESISTHNASVVINKNNRSMKLYLNYSNIQVNQVIDIDSGDNYNVGDTGLIDLRNFDAYKVKFYKYGLEPYKSEDNSFDGIVKYNPGYLNLTAADYDLRNMTFEWKGTNYTIIENGAKVLDDASNFSVTTKNGSRVWNVSLKYNDHDLEAGNHSYSFYLSSYDNNHSSIFKHQLTISKGCAWSGTGDFIVSGQTCYFNDPYIDYRGGKIGIDNSVVNIQAMPKNWKTLTIGPGSKVII